MASNSDGSSASILDRSSTSMADRSSASSSEIASSSGFLKQDRLDVSCHPDDVNQEYRDMDTPLFRKQKTTVSQQF